MVLTDILVLGATGFTGRHITRYLKNHPQKSNFSFAVAGRSKSKLADLTAELSLGSDIPTILVDITNEKNLDEAVKGCRVVLNTIGPFWTYGTPVVAACIKNGKHYVDISGEVGWTKDIIDLFDYAATKAQIIILTFAGFDAIPSDAAVFLANRTLKSLNFSPPPDIGRSTSSFSLGLTGGFSFGSISTLMAQLEDMPRAKFWAAMEDWLLSPIRGRPSPPDRLLYHLRFHPDICGTMFPLANGNRAIVQRTWGLLEREARSSAKSSNDQYGPEFQYEEFMVVPNAFLSLLVGLCIAVAFGSLIFLSPARWLVKKIAYKPGQGPPEDAVEDGYFELTNITTSIPTSSAPLRHVKTTIKGRGEPAYFLTAVMVAESALSLLLSHESLPELGKRGGVLTPMSALGSTLLDRLENSGRFIFESSVLTDKKSS